MKHINILAAIMLLLISGQRVCAQTENGFKEIDVANNFGDNPFTFSPARCCLWQVTASRTMP